MGEPGLLARVLGRAVYEFTLMRPMIPTYGHLLISALFPIYAGAHASLSRPTSAAKPKTRSTKDDHEDGDESSDDEDEEFHKMDGLSPKDALLMPLFAGCTLAGLYFLIKWLQDPTLFNKLLNAYFAIFGVFSVAKLLTDALDWGHSFIFPRRFVYKGILYHVHGKEKRAVAVAGDPTEAPILSTPLPGFLARIPFSKGMRELLWSDRAWPRNKWTIRVYLHRLFAGKVLVGPHGLLGFTVSMIAVIYFNVVDKPWYLTNLMGFGFSYGALQLMSPTTFATGSMILGALFFYDTYFVFFTPMMVTVAKSLDVPIKLVFPRPAPADEPTALPGHAMLGLGDVVLPGIMIGLALRFDLFLFYLRRQKYIPAKEEQGKPQLVKPRYFSLAGRWSDHFWTHTLFGRPLFKNADDNKPEPHFTFPKTYFKASIIGYVLGMLATLGVMHVWGHAQPALLYLVPGVLGSLWLTALVQGDLKLMWEFSEADEDEDFTSATGDKEDAKKSNSSQRTSFFSLSEKKSREREARLKKTINKHVKHDSDDEKGGEGKDILGKPDQKVEELAGHKPERELFSFSIEFPRQLKQPRSIRRGSSSKPTTGGEAESPLKDDEPIWAPPENEKTAEEPAGKRIRLK